jgi:hypothetical protein
VVVGLDAVVRLLERQCAAAGATRRCQEQRDTNDGQQGIGVLSHDNSD